MSPQLATSTSPTTSGPAQRFDVLVVGAGPAGLTTALGLARHGVRVLVVEKHAGTSTFPKASGIRPRTMEIFRGWGLESRVRAAGQDVRMEVAISATLRVAVQAVEDLGVPDDDYLSRVSPSRFAFVPQDRLEPVLLDEVRVAGGEVRFRTELSGFEVCEDGVRAHLRPRDGDAPAYDVAARYLVGADGARSHVRRALGVPMRHLGSHGRHVAVLFTADLDRLMPGPSYALRWVTTPGAEGLLVASGPGRWTFDWEVDAAAAEPSPEHAARRIRAAAGAPDLPLEVLRIFPWDMAAELADAMRDGPVFLVGDAAHRTTPRGATGMNTGIAAAHNLAWKLAWVLRGWAHDSLLDTYEDERRPVGRANTQASLRERGDLPVEPGAMDFGVTYDTAEPEPLEPPGRPGLAVVTGRRAPHAWIHLPGGRRLSTLDLFVGRLTLVTGPEHEEWSAAAAALTGPAPVTVVALGVDVPDPDGSTARLYGVASGGAVLVRPDGHVVWRTQEPGGYAALQHAQDRVTGLTEPAEPADRADVA